MRPYDVRDLSLGAYLALVGLLLGLVAGATVAQQRHETQARTEARTVAAALARPGCAPLPAVDSRVGIASPSGWVNVGYTSGCLLFGPVRLTLTDPREAVYRSVELGQSSGGNGAVLPLTDDLPLGLWTAALDVPGPRRVTTTDVRLASRVVLTSPTSARATVYDPAADAFRPWRTTVEVQHLTSAGWRAVSRAPAAADGTAAVDPPAAPGRYRLATLDTPTVFGSSAALSVPAAGRGVALAG